MLTIGGLIIMEILTDSWVKRQVVPKNRALGQRTEKSQLWLMLQIKWLLYKNMSSNTILGSQQHLNHKVHSPSLWKQQMPLVVI